MRHFDVAPSDLPCPAISVQAPSCFGATGIDARYFGVAPFDLPCTAILVQAPSCFDAAGIGVRHFGVSSFDLLCTVSHVFGFCLSLGDLR